MLVKDAQAIVKPAAGNTKMNCGCWGLPTSTCEPHSPNDPDSTCHPSNCYAKRNQYNFPNVKQAQKERLEHTADRDFVIALTTILNRNKYFRFFDSGDFPNAMVMQAMMRACRLAPFTKIHIPTKAYRLVEWYKLIYPVPENVVLRVGMWEIDPDTKDVLEFVKKHENVAVVSRKAWTHPYVIGDTVAHVCPAAHDNPDGPKQCVIDCDWCWHNDNEVVVFPWH